MERLEFAIMNQDLETNKFKRGFIAQAHKRSIECDLRRRCLALMRLGKARHNLAQKRAADLIGLKPGTLWAWHKQRENRTLCAKFRGRPVEVIDPETRADILSILDLLGPWTGVPCLQDLFPDVPRAILDHFLARYRRAYIRTKGQVFIHALHWKKAGSVWAMDQTQPPAPIDGEFAQVLLVRDIASSNALAWMPVPDKDDAHVWPVLKDLFNQHGPPLVIKSDNGGEFTSHAMLRFLSENGVFHLPSPPRMPRYNGACEAGIGWLKTYAHPIAARYNRPGEWTANDVEEARLRANAVARPLGRMGPSPDKAWKSRELITDQMRQRFFSEAMTESDAVTVELGYDPNAILDRNQTARRNRLLLTRTLTNLDYLSIRRRRITLPI